MITRMLVALALMATLVGCGRSQAEENAYNYGWGYADNVMTTVNIYSETELLDSCATRVRDESGYIPKSDEANAFRDGCSDRWKDER